MVIVALKQKFCVMSSNVGAKKEQPDFFYFQRVLDEYDIPPEDYELMQIENMRECSDIQDYMMELTGGRTVSWASPSFCE